MRYSTPNLKNRSKCWLHLRYRLLQSARSKIILEHTINAMWCFDILKTIGILSPKYFHQSPIFDSNYCRLHHTITDNSRWSNRISKKESTVNFSFLNCSFSRRIMNKWVPYVFGQNVIIKKNLGERFQMDLAQIIYEYCELEIVPVNKTVFKRFLIKHKVTGNFKHSIEFTMKI